MSDPTGTLVEDGGALLLQDRTHTSVIFTDKESCKLNLEAFLPVQIADAGSPIWIGTIKHSSPSPTHSQPQSRLGTWAVVATYTLKTTHAIPVCVTFAQLSDVG